MICNRAGAWVERMKQMTLTEAAKASGKSKSTIFRAVKSGKLSATRDGEEYRIDPAELFRVFPVEPSDTVQRNDLEPKGETAERVEIRMLRELLEAREEQISDLRREVETARALLTSRMPEKQPGQGFWSRLLGR
jgi:excisionase family DNA binding protein